MKMKLNTDYNFNKRDSRIEQDMMGTMHIPWSNDLASIDGCHFHVWIPRIGVESEKSIKERFVRETRNRRDAVSFSWDYIPTEHERIVNRKDFAGDEPTMFEAATFVVLKPIIN